MVGLISGRLSPRAKAALKTYFNRLNRRLTDAFFSYGEEELVASFQKLGLMRGDTVLLHSSFRNASGFTGSPQAVIDCLLRTLGAEGNLLMVSMPYGVSSYEYLQTQPVFDVNKTISKMGIISEVFRRRQGVLRSLHPTHPVLAYGDKARWIVEDHERSPYPCGPDTPFGKLRALKGKVAFFNVPFRTFTFIHHIEHLIQDDLPFPLYTRDPIPARVVDGRGKELTVSTYVFDRSAYKARVPELLQAELRRSGCLRTRRVGRTTLMAVCVEDAVHCTREMVRRGVYFYSGILRGHRGSGRVGRTSAGDH